MTQDLEIKDNKNDNALELWVDGKRSFIEYEIEGKNIYLLHTEVPSEQNGQGIAADLVQKSFAYLEEHNFKVIPACSYVRAFLKRHPDWERIVAIDDN
jgi:predicted GNAT family acetyltransferase